MGSQTGLTLTENAVDLANEGHPNGLVTLRH